MRYLFYLFICTGLQLVSSCKKLIDAGAPKTTTTAEITFNDPKTATAALMGIYASLEGFRQANVSTLPGLAADELISYSTPISRYYTNSLSAASNNEFWSPFYAHIYQANALIAGVEQSTGITETDKKQLVGEAQFLRAFVHFYLVNYFGDVPFVTSTDYELNATLPRMSAKDSVYPSILRDLISARENLREEYPSEQRVRVNKSVATAMLARVYLYTSQWEKAEEAATELIESSEYALGDLDNAFQTSSPEPIWQLSPNQMSLPYSSEAYVYILRNIPQATPGRVSISPFLLDAFEPGDQRRVQWIGELTPEGSNTTFFYAWKYKTNTATGPQEFSTPLRLAEQYLIRAEARAMQEKVSLAIDDLNVIRARAGLQDLADHLSKQQCLDQVIHERQVELFVEWGHRWLDLKRTGLVNTVMPAVCESKGGTWNADWALYPIPQVQLLTDPAMADDQNPGY